MNQQRASSSNFRQTPGVITNGAIRYGNQVISQPPPLPPRNHVNSTYYQPYNSITPSYLGGYGNNYSPFGAYNSPSYRPNYGNFYGPSGDVESRLIQYAEERSRPAFESIESIVHTFSSITMMFESTYFAMTSSFRAILSVADNIGKARNMFSQILNTFALIRFTKWLYHWILFKLGLCKNDPNTDSVWQKAVLETVNGEKTGPSTWPILIFLSLLLGIPYLVHKIVKNIDTNDTNDKNPKEWLSMNDPVFTANVVYDFQAARSNEMSIKMGQKIWLAPESIQPKNNPGWCKATDGTNIGLIPSNYVQIVGEMKKKVNQDAPKDSEIKYNMEESFQNSENSQVPLSETKEKS